MTTLRISPAAGYFQNVTSVTTKGPLYFVFELFYVFRRLLKNLWIQLSGSLTPINTGIDCSMKLLLLVCEIKPYGLKKYTLNNIVYPLLQAETQFPISLRSNVQYIFTWIQFSFSFFQIKLTNLKHFFSSNTSTLNLLISETFKQQQFGHLANIQDQMFQNIIIPERYFENKTNYVYLCHTKLRHSWCLN